MQSLPRTPRKKELVDHYESRHDEHHGFSRVGVPFREYAPVGEVTIPVAFWIEPAAFPVRIEVELEKGRPECVAVRRRKDGPALTSDSVRIPLSQLITEATRVVSRELKSRAGDWAFYGPAPAERVEAAIRRPKRGRGARMEDSLLQEVAAVYREAHARREAPVVAIVERFQVAYPTAGRWVREARERDFLGPALKTQAGEKGDE
jgi:hypothetical protein